MVSEANFDQASERRRVREAFKDMQLGSNPYLFIKILHLLWVDVELGLFGFLELI